MAKNLDLDICNSVTKISRLYSFPCHTLIAIDDLLNEPFVVVVSIQKLFFNVTKKTLALL